MGVVKEVIKYLKVFFAFEYSEYVIDIPSVELGLFYGRTVFLKNHP